MMYAVLPVDIFSGKISYSDFRVLGVLVAHKGKNDDAWPSVSRIAEMTGIAQNNVSRALTRLEKSGMIAREKTGTRNRYTFPCLDSQAGCPADAPAPTPQPVVAKNATAAAPVSAPAPEPVREPVPVATPEPAPEQPTADNPSHVAEPEPATVPQPVAEPEPAPAPVQPPASEQPRAQQAAPAPVVAPAAAQEQKPAPAPVVTQKPTPMPALEPAPPAPRREIVSARVARLPDVDDAVRREVDARPVVKSSGEKEVDPELMARAKRLQALCAENTARSREQKAAAQRFKDGVTAATEQVAKQRAAQDIAAARQRAAQNAVAPTLAPVAPVTKTEEQAVKTDELRDKHEELEAKTEELTAPAELLSPAEQLPVPVESIAQPAPDETEPITLPVVEHETHESAPQAALQVIDAPQTTVVQGELLPVPVTAGQGELLPVPQKKRGGSRANGHRIPKDWYLTKKLGMWAREKYGLDDDTIRSEADKFIDHWTASANPNAWKCDWDAAWRNWIRKYAESGGTASGAPQQKSKMTQALENLANMNLDWEHQEDWNPFAKMTDKERADAQNREDAKRNKERE